MPDTDIPKTLTDQVRAAGAHRDRPATPTLDDQPGTGDVLRLVADIAQEMTQPERRRSVRAAGLRILDSLGLLGLPPEPTHERQVLDRIRKLTPSNDDYLATLGHAHTIAQVGGIDARTLDALLFLAANRELTSAAARALHNVGISTQTNGGE